MSGEAYAAAVPEVADYVQQDQPEGVPPLAADRRAHAARRAGGELLVPAPPGGVRVDRRALRRARRGGHGLRRGLRHRRAGAPRRAGDRRGRQPRGARARGRQVHRARACASSATWSTATPSPATPWSSSRRSSTWRTRRRCCATSRRCAGRAVYVSTPNVLTLAPEGAEKSDNPWHLKEYRPEEFARAVRVVLRSRGAARPLPRAQAARARAGAARRAGTRVHAALGLTKPFYDRFTPGDLRARLRAAPRPAGARARLRRGAAVSAWAGRCPAAVPAGAARPRARGGRPGTASRPWRRAPAR